jgi:malate/lactate dehydrogenase
MKVVIAGGAGGVGSSVAFNLLVMRGRHEVVLVDRRPEMIASHVMDLEQTLEQGASGSVRAGSPADLDDADVVVVTAAAPLTVNTSRMVYLNDNAAILGRVLERIGPGWGGVLLVVTNPVDPLCTWAWRRTGLDRGRVLGYTLNDSLRLRTAVAAEVGAAPGEVDAWVVGEHGDLSVPLFDRVRVGGAAVELTAGQRAAAEAFLRSWYVRHVALDSNRSSTWTSGLGVARMVAEIAAPTGAVWPVSTPLEGEYGVDGVCLSVPAALGRGGLERIHRWELTPAQLAGVHAGAEFVHGAAAAIRGEGTS